MDEGTYGRGVYTNTMLGSAHNKKYEVIGLLSIVKVFAHTQGAE